MRRYFSLIFIIMLLSGCSELQVIGNGALRELRAEGKNVEAISYNYHQKLAAKADPARVPVAKTETGAKTTKGNTAAGRILTAKSSRIKGLWEKH